MSTLQSNSKFISFDSQILLGECSNNEYNLDQTLCVKSKNDFHPTYTNLSVIDFRDNNVLVLCKKESQQYISSGLSTQIMCSKESSAMNQCGHVYVKYEKDLDKTQNCNALESLVISFQETNVSPELTKKFEEAFAKIKSIKYFLWIFQTPTLKSLEFLNNLEFINQDRKNMRKHSIEVSWNPLLDTLWNAEKLSNSIYTNYSISTDIIFSNNANLCNKTIESFFSTYFSIAANHVDFFSFSNGYFPLCYTKNLQIRATNLTHDSVEINVFSDSHIIMENPFLKITLMYYRLDKNMRIFQNTQWQSRISDVSPKLTNLLPNSTYRVHATAEISTGEKLYVSDDIEINTLFKMPNSTLTYQATYLTSNSTKFVWIRWKEKIDFFQIRILRENPLRETEVFVDNCEYVIHYPALIGQRNAERFIAKNDSDWIVRTNDDVSLADCYKQFILQLKSIKNTLRKKFYDKIFENYLFEDQHYLRYMLIPGEIKSSFKFDSGYNSHQQLERFANNPNMNNRVNRLRMKRSTDQLTKTPRDYIKRIELLVNETHVEDIGDSLLRYEYILNDLKHYTDYQFSIEACVYVKNRTSCSQPKFLYLRTVQLAEKNIINGRDVIVTRDQESIKFFWSSLIESNGPVIRYWLRKRKLSMQEIRSNYHYLNWFFGIFSSINKESHAWSYECIQVYNNQTLNLTSNSELIKIFDNHQDRASTIIKLAQDKGTLSYSPHVHIDDGVYEVEFTSETETFFSEWSSPPTRFQVFNASFYNLAYKENEFSQLINLINFERINSLAINIFFLTFASLLLLISLIVAGIKIRFYVVRKTAMNNYMNLFNRLLGVFTNDEWELDDECICFNQDDMPKFLSKKNLPIGQIFGMGSFGLVYQGWLSVTPAMIKNRTPLRLYLEMNEYSDETTHNSIRYIPVAIKTMKESASGSDIRDFLTEASFMKQFQSAHIVQLLGLLCKKLLNGEKPMLIMELMEKGDLNNYLLNLRGQEEQHSGKIPDALAIKWAGNIADGIFYLHSKGIIHRDLAARNCFVSGNLTIKIGDFGLARNIQDHYYYRKNGNARVPVRWMAPETLNDAFFTTKSDVWSYGVTLWEISTFATLPYFGMTHPEVTEFVMAGKTLDIPTKFPDVLTQIMKSAWEFDRKDRPEFEEILEKLYPELDQQFKKISYYSNSCVLQKKEV